ncbi:MAG: type I-E CRISPR-associated protein Cse2/CasB [Armatimonadia bacterium]
MTISPANSAASPPPGWRWPLKPSSHDRLFAGFLCKLVEAGQAHALATFLRGLGRPPGAVPAMLRWLGPWTLDATRRERDACFLVASLFALHPCDISRGNLGTVFAQLRALRGPSESLERRFSAILRASHDDLPLHLRRVVGLARSAGVPINWAQLLNDVKQWDYRTRHVQLSWAREYWSTSQDAPPALS